MPFLVMRQRYNQELDYDILNNMLSNCAVTFSMVSEDTGVYKILNKPAEIVTRTKPYKDEYPLEYLLLYRWKKSDTNKVGLYRGEFRIDFLGQEYCDLSLTVPIEQTLYINVRDTITKTEVIYR